MKKITLFIASMFIAMSLAHADNYSLNDKIISALNNGDMLKEVTVNLGKEYGITNVLGALFYIAPEDMQSSIMKIAQEIAPHFVNILASLQKVDSKVIRHEKPTHNERNTDEHVILADNSDQNQFDPNAFAPTAAGEPSDGNPDSVSP